MNGAHEYAVSPDFTWSSEYDRVLENLATSDYVKQDWNKLRDMIKYKLNQNIVSYLSDPPPPPPPEPPVAPEPPTDSPESASTAATLSPRVFPAIGAKFPPFPRREQNQFIRNQFNSHGRPKTVLTEEEAKKMYEAICKLLHEFEGTPPFTIQRVCELMVRPRAHFKYAGKYLRAVERALAVTSTIDVFPVITPEQNDASSSPFMSVGSLREATTPLFSPIPFLHEDARRSRSRSPPMSPLSLATAPPQSPAMDPLQLGDAGDASGPAIGLVDELDDPSPGHMSEHPTALTSTTTTTTTTPAESESSSNAGRPPSSMEAAPSAAPRPLFGGSLAERFVKATGSESETSTVEPGSGEGMSADENEADKENVPKS